MLYTFDEPEAPERHDLQYFEMFGNRGIYHKGWSAVTKHRTPWIMVGGVVPAFDDDIWELYDGDNDYSQAHNLAADNPEMLAKLQRLWLIEATKYNALPLDDRVPSVSTPETAGRPTLIRGNSQLFFPGMGRLSESSVVNIKNKSFSVTAEVDVPATGVVDGCDDRPRWPVRRLGLLRQGRQGKVLLQPARHPVVRHRGRFGDPSRQPPGTNGARLRRRRARQGRKRHPLLRRRRRRHRTRRARPSRWSSPPTRPPTSATNPVPPSVPTTPPTPAGSPARSNGCGSTLGDDNHDHYIDPEERLRIALSMQ